MKILKLALLITFLFNSTAYPYQDMSDNLRVPMIGDKANKDRLESAGTLTSGDNVKNKIELAKSLLRRKLRIAVNEKLIAEAAISAAKALEQYGDFDVRYVPEHKEPYAKYDQLAADTARYDHTTMEHTIEERIEILPPGSAGTKLASGHNVGATDQKKRFSLQDYRPGWTFAGWGAAKMAIKQKFTSTKERKEALQLVRTFLVKEVTKSRNTYPLRDAILEYTLHYAIPAVIDRAENPNELEELFTIAIDTVKNFYPVFRAALDECRRLHGDNFETWGTDLEFSIYKARDVKRCYGNYIMRYSYDKPRFAYSPVFVNQPYWRIEFRCNISPLTNLSNLKLTPTLFLDREVTVNPDAFKQSLAQLKSNEGNIPVVLLTEETKDSIIAKLKGIDLTGVEFRTKVELGLQDLQWDKDERVSLIDGIDNLKCIPLTKALCETYKDLQKARDQV